MEKMNKDFVLCGDLNGHNPLWGSKNIDKNGNTIEEFMIKHDLVCVNNGDGTRINPVNGTLSCIDITVTSPCI